MCRFPNSTCCSLLRQQLFELTDIVALAFGSGSTTLTLTLYL
jgi:hypothetical protein